MYKQLRFLTTMLLLAVCCGTWAEEVTYTISSKNTLAVTGTAPANSSATIAETYQTSCQMTSGNSQTLTLKGYDGCRITKVTLSMRSNKSSGAGNFSYSTDGGTNYTYVIGSANSGSNFNSSYWHGSWSTSYVDVDIKDDQENLLTFDCGSSDVKIKIEATANSIYCQSYTLTYTNTSSDLEDCDLALANAPVSLNFDLYNSSAAQTISYTTSSTGTVSVANSDYATFVVDQTNKTITVTPTAVTNGAQTITVNQAADENYAAGSATFTVTITDDTPVADYVTLPFTWEGGTSSELTALQGVTTSGLGSDYAESHNPYRIKLDGTGDYIQFKTNETPGKVTIGVKMIGGATASKITVQGSNNGETFTDVQELTISGSQNDVLELETTNSFAATDRYVRLLFTRGSNVGVGPISIEKAAALQTLTVAASNGSVAITGHELENNTCSLSQGSSVTATATPNEHYKFTSWTVDGVTLEDNTANPLTFTMPANAVTLTANFTLKETHTATFYANGVQVGEAITVYEGEDINFPSVNDIEGYSVVGWLTSTFDGITPTAPTGMVTSATMGTENVVYHAVLAIKTATDQTLDETQTLQYDTWTYSGETTNKTTYRLFGEGSYIESAAFNLSYLTKVNVYAGTFGTLDNDKKIVYVKAGDTEWGSATLSTNKETTKNEITSSTMLSGQGVLHIVAGGGDGSNNGIRISKVEIFTSEPIYSYSNYCTTIPTPTITVADATVNVDANEHEGTMAITYENLAITDMTDFDIQYYDSNNNELEAKPSWIMVEVAEQDPQVGEGYVVSYYMEENIMTDPRSVYFKVYALDGDANVVYSNLVTITQAAASTATITLNAACHDADGMVYGTYSNTSAFVVSDDIVVAEVGIVEGKLNVKEYETGAVVPANTGVMVSAFEGGNYTVTLTDEDGTSVLGEYNNLRPTGAEGINATDMAAAEDVDCLYYRLTMHNGTTIGFWWGAEDGAAFSVGANKAYLAVPANQAKAGFAFEGGDATSISTIDNGQLTMENAYNLQGQKVGSAYRGIVIVNGKKFINK